LEAFERKKAQKKALSAAASSAVSTVVQKADIKLPDGGAVEKNGDATPQIQSGIPEEGEAENIPPATFEPPETIKDLVGIHADVSASSVARDEHAVAPSTPTDGIAGSPTSVHPTASLPPVGPRRLDASAESIRQQNDRLQAELDLMTSTQAGVHEQNAILQRELADTRTALSAAQERLNTADRAYQQRIQVLEAELRAASATEQDLSSLQEQLEAFKQKETQAEAQRAALNAQLAEIQGQLSGALRDSTKAEARRAEVEGRLREAEKEVADTKEALVAALRNAEQRRDVEAELAALKEELQSRDAELAAVKAEAVAAEAQLEELRQHAEAVESSLAVLQAEHAGGEAQEKEIVRPSQSTEKNHSLSDFNK
jgi:hypothetical protein